MKARISVLTIGVSDLDRSLAFYRDGLGLPTEGIVGREFEHGAVAFFTLAGGLKLAIWSQDDIAHDTGLPKSPMSPTSFTIGTQRRQPRRSRPGHERGGACRRGHPQAGARNLLRWLCQLLPRPGRHVWEVIWNPAFIPNDDV